MKGQAMVEFALILPLILFMFLGIVAIQLAILDRTRLTHAASEGAIAGALNPGDSCGVALTTVHKVYGSQPTSETCRQQAQFIIVDLTHTLPFPGWDFDIHVTEQAVIR